MQTSVLWRPAPRGVRLESGETAATESGSIDSRALSPRRLHAPRKAGYAPESHVRYRGKRGLSSPNAATSVNTGRPSLKVEFAALTLARLFSAGVQAVILLVAVRALSPFDFALFASLLAAAAVAVVVADLGTTPTIIRAAAVGATSEVGRNLSLARSAGLLVAGAWFLLAWCLPVGVTDKLSVSSLALYLLAERLYEGRAAVLVGNGAGIRSAIILVVRRTVLLSTVAISSYLGAASLSELILMIVIPSVAFISLEAVSAIRCSTRLESARKKSVSSKPSNRRASHAAYLNSLGVHARQLDAPIVAAALGASASAPYVAVSRLINPARLISASMSAALLASASRQPRQNFRKPLRALLAVNVTGATGLIFFSDWVAGILFGGAYADASHLLKLAAPGFAAAGMCSAYTSLLQARYEDRLVAAISVGFLLVTLEAFL